MPMLMSAATFSFVHQKSNKHSLRVRVHFNKEIEDSANSEHKLLHCLQFSFHTMHSGS